MERYTTPDPFEIPTWEGQPDFYRADLQFHGVEHRGDSYEGRVFLGNPEANPQTPLELDAGYAGSFYVFGHGPCYGDEGHCEVPAGPIHPFDYRRPHPLNPQVLVVTVTDALKQLIDRGNSAVEVTVIPSNVRDEDVGDVLRFEQLSLVTYDAYDPET
jgi:tyrosinase